jgi:hypothetical protein
MSNVKVMEVYGEDGHLLDRWEVARLRIGPDKVEVGMIATHTIGSDDYAGTITAVRRNGQSVTFATTHGRERIYTWRRSREKYVERGQDWGTLTIGVAEDYLDPSF